MSDIDDVIDTLDLRGHGHVLGGMIICARAELAQLRATVAAQAEQLREAQRIITRAKDVYIECIQAGYDYYEDVEMCDDWLAANAPQTPEEPHDRVDRMLDASGFEHDEIAEV